MKTWHKWGSRTERLSIGHDGHSLIELLVALSILLLVLFFPTVSLLRGLNVLGARSQAQNLQGAAALAQVRATNLGLPTSVTGDPSSIEVVDSLGVLNLTAPSPILSTSTNLSRWRAPYGYSVTFGSGAAAPNGAGSVFFGDSGWGSRVVIRAESGVTRRERQ